ncbi:hypothetical protein [Aequorivita capsosiphonis]|uniref:hypothetical protein n=1 Tax=Aequorivita capsosiphonis TaxID=487317 RepID=UPI0012F878FD|nr:hypothetical protein [Aequorivita capsosiphonis]
MTLPKFNFKSILAFLFISAAVLTSCKDNEQRTDIETNTPQEATLEQKKQALQNVAPTSNNASSTGDMALNPAHGQPGHSCKIPVGAPLNGTGSTKASPIKMDMNKTNATPASGSGINPPHGQPGHRCDIQVGEPL